jgi:acetyl-CoA carboxylase carboxyl transferase subunit alpha
MIRFEFCFRKIYFSSFAHIYFTKQKGAWKMSNKLTVSERLELIRNKNRPTVKDYIPLIFGEFFELHGDRFYGDDKAVLAGLARLDGKPVTVVAQVKGRNIAENKKTNFSMPHPEGYRKALRLIKQAEKFGRPVICFIDTPGAFCGISAEERGQGEAIARNLAELMRVKTPVVSVVLGEGGSGGALALGVCDKLGMLSNAVYSVISPRGCASILWKDAEREREAAEILKITAEDLADFGVADTIISEAKGGAHKDVAETAKNIKNYLVRAVAEAEKRRRDGSMLEERYRRYRVIGGCSEELGVRD